MKTTASLSRGTISFIEKASKQKKVEWLDKNRAEYEREVIVPLKTIAQHLKTKLSPIAKDYHFPQQGLGRLKRSKLSLQQYGGPIKDYISYSAKRPAQSRFDHNPSIFLLVYPADQEGDEVLLAGGLYMPSSRQLKSIRQAIAVNATPFENLFKSKAFASRFPGGFCDERKSTRVPRGFDANHPQVEWLKHQGYFVWRSYKPKEYTSPSFGDLLVKDARQILRLNDLLDQAIDGRWIFEEPKKQDMAFVLGRTQMDF